MNRNYIYLTALLLVIAAGVLFIPMRNNSRENQAEELLQKLNSPARMVSTDQVASWIIEQDPSLLLIDVRSVEDYDSFSIEGAINIPLAEIFEDKWIDYLSAEGMNKVFYSFGDIDAEKAWVLSYRKGFENIYFLQGGLNCWAKTILDPQKPNNEASNNEMDLYSFRRGASLYFKGGEITVPETKIAAPIKVVRKKAPPKKIIPVKVEEEEEEGGC